MARNSLVPRSASRESVRGTGLLQIPVWFENGEEKRWVEGGVYIGEGAVAWCVYNEGGDVSG